MPFPSSICTKATSEAKIIKLRSFSVGSPVVPIVLEDTAFSIFFDGLDFEVLEHVNSAPRDQLKLKMVRLRQQQQFPDHDEHH